MALLTARDLSLGYDSRVIVRGLSFRVDAGDYLCIVGENGSGKSTLMKTLLGLQPPLGGSIETGDGLMQNEIGYLPQQTVVQRDFPASVREIVLSGCQGRCGLRPFYSAGDRRLAAENMGRMGISELANRCYRELSGGQQQRVLLARALCATRKMYELIASLNREGVTVIMISHDIAAALRYASHILHIGAAVFFGTKADYLQSDAGKLFLTQQKGGEA